MIKRFNPIVFLIVLFLLCAASPCFSMSAADVEKHVAALFAQSEIVPQVRIIPTEGGRFIVELGFSIGDRWGRDGFVRDLAKGAITRIFKSALPLAQGVVKVCCAHAEIVHLGIGVNQAKQIGWEDHSSSSGFFEMLRSCAHWGEKPEDRTYFIEHRQIIRPSPIILLPPHS